MVVVRAGAVEESSWRNLTRLLLLPLLARFSLMGQLHALKIHFERQPRQVRAVGNSEQNFGNSADRFPHQALVPLWISVMALRMWWFRKASSRVRRIARLRRPSMTIVTRAVTITISTTAPVVALTYHEVFPCHRTAFSATPMNATTMPITAAVIRDWKRDAEANLNTFLRCW